MSRILLSGPDVGQPERDALLRAFDDGWIAPVGPELSLFETELAAYTGAEACVALASGTGALHLALLDVGVQPGDEVVVQSATFAASAFAAVHAGAVPVFCDVDTERWCLSVELVEELLAKKAAIGSLPKAIMPVDLYGACADYDELVKVCERYEVPIVEDAAEALGSIQGGRMAGTFGRSGVLSFNGNKIMTTSGGGALLGSAEVIDRARYLATQARLPELHYEHVDIGFNYRMSNLLAALGRAQLAGLEAKIKRREAIYQRYLAADGLAELSWCPFAGMDRPNRWLSVAMLPDGFDPTTVCRALEAKEIEARPAWKPMHLQPVFSGSEMVGGSVSEELFTRGLCLPSGSALTDDQVDRVIGELSAILAAGPQA